MFKDHIAQSGQNQSQWAQRLGISKGYLSDILSGKRGLTLELAVRIERETKGAVPANSWVPEPDSVPAPSPVTPNEDAA